MQTIELPIWLFALILLFATFTALTHLLLPSVRWFFRRRLEKAVARINRRLTRPINPFKLVKRYDMIQRLIYDPQVAQAISDHANINEIPENVAFEQARSYAREIVPGFSAFAYFGILVAFRPAHPQGRQHHGSSCFQLRQINASRVSTVRELGPGFVMGLGITPVCHCPGVPSVGAR